MRFGIVIFGLVFVFCLSVPQIAEAQRRDPNVGSDPREVAQEADENGLRQMFDRILGNMTSIKRLRRTVGKMSRYSRTTRTTLQTLDREFRAEAERLSRVKADKASLKKMVAKAKRLDSVLKEIRATLLGVANSKSRLSRGFVETIDRRIAAKLAEANGVLQELRTLGGKVDRLQEDFGLLEDDVRSLANELYGSGDKKQDPGLISEVVANQKKLELLDAKVERQRVRFGVYSSLVSLGWNTDESMTGLVVGPCVTVGLFWRWTFDTCVGLGYGGTYDDHGTLLVDVPVRFMHNWSSGLYTGFGGQFVWTTAFARLKPDTGHLSTKTYDALCGSALMGYHWDENVYLGASFLMCNQATLNKGRHEFSVGGTLDFRASF